MSIDLITSITQTSTGTQSQAALDKATDQSFAALLDGDGTPEETIKDITKDGFSGYWAWQLKQMAKKAAEDVMNQMGITKDDLAKMAPAERAATERKIMKQVEEQVKKLIAQEMEKNKDHKTPGIGGIAEGSLASLLTEQEIGA